jgi:ABC-2 type transport system permease protein
MHKIWLIIKREYLTRVRKRTFIISTLLFPLLYLLLIFGMGYLADRTRQNLRVAIYDKSGYFTQSILTKQDSLDKNSSLILVNDTANFKEAGFDGYIVIPPIDWKKGDADLIFLSDKSYGNSTTVLVERKLNKIWDDIKNDSLQIDATKRQILVTSQLGVTPRDRQQPSADAGIAEGIGYACGFLIYFILLIYGSQVMMGVMEEKTNRIAEVIVSSVKPFQMMLGKIVGIGLVALTQFFLWIAFVIVVYNIAKVSGSGGGMANAVVGNMQKMFTGVNLPLIIFCFAFYFLAGFFFYASLYGAIGSAVNEDMREAQSLSFPVTMLVILSIALMTTAINNPTGPVAVWASIIPFSSPIVMMARIPYGVPGTVPLWQLGLSMGLLILGFIFTTWFAGKIYRTGILMYGKKPSWREMMRWAFRRS